MTRTTKRERRDREYRALFERAHAAGMAAAEARMPVPMVVEQHADPLNDASPVVRRYGPYADGVCGFAWIVIRPGTGAPAVFAKQYWGARKAYEGGVSIWVGQFNQSMEKKEAYARAFADVLREGGINASWNSRMD